MPKFEDNQVWKIELQIEGKGINILMVFFNRCLHDYIMQSGCRNNRYNSNKITFPFPFDAFNVISSKTIPSSL